MARLPQNAGITLIEILIAVSIMGIVSAAITLSMTTGHDPIRDEANRLAIRLQHASQESIVTGQPIGFSSSAGGDGYVFSHYRDGLWIELNQHPTLQRHVLGESMHLAVENGLLPDEDIADEEEADLIPAFWFDPSALTDPFTISLFQNGNRVDLTWNASLDRIEISPGERS